MGTIYTESVNATQVSWKTLVLKNWPIFPASCGHVVDWPYVTQVRFWRPKIKASFGIKTCHLAMPLIMGQKKCGLLKSIDFLFFTFYGSKSGTLGQKNRGFECFEPSVR